MSPTNTHIILHPQLDNVAIALKPLAPGDPLADVTVAEPIRAYHKIALADLGADQPVYKYGQIIGYATEAI
ncbi:MAG: UxaA family hydrolase, partial [Candidatus Latescibacteria bacterium]|nr:UxaA family hydrolase [Candidatus Latescibacterota bacterium]